MGYFFKTLLRGFQEHHFSKRIVLVYSIIMLIPLVLFFTVICSLIRNRQMVDIEHACFSTAMENYQVIQNNKESVNLIENMLAGNSELLLFLSNAGELNEDELISTTIAQSVSLERILQAQRYISAIRVFSDNKAVPERFPVLLHSNRTHFSRQREWYPNYSVDFMNNISYREKETMCLSDRLLNGRRALGYYHISMNMDDFFPFLYTEQKNDARDYILREVRENKFEPVTGNRLKLFNPVPDRKFFDSLEKYASKNNPAIKASRKPEVFRISDSYHKYAAVMTYDSDMELYFIHMQKADFFDLSFMVVLVLGVMGIITSALLFFIVVSYVTSRIMSGVYTIVDGMEKVRGGDFSVRIPVSPHHDEITDSQITFNSMTETLLAQIEQIKNEQSLIAETETKAMLNQINAHFLYNVLETIHMQAVLNEDDETAESILILGKMMHYCLRWRVHSVQLQQELDYINSYVQILNIRNDYKITLKVDVASKFMNLDIPKMILQPVVENAFYHGIEELASDSVIRIFTQTEPEKNIVNLCVQDFGKGMTEQKLEELRKYLLQTECEKDTGGGIGLKNIQQRLFMFYGEQYKIELYSKENEGTLVKIPVPLNQEE